MARADSAPPPEPPCRVFVPAGVALTLTNEGSQLVELYRETAHGRCSFETVLIGHLRPGETTRLG